MMCRLTAGAFYGSKKVLLTTRGDSTPQSFVIVENWTEELKRLVPTN